MSSPIKTVLVTGVGGPAGISICRQLRATTPDIRIIGTDIREVEPLVDLFLLGPRADSPELLIFLGDVVAKYGVDVVIPTVQDELPIVAAGAKELGCEVIMSGPAAVEVCHDKLLTALRLQKHGLAVPWTRIGSATPVSYPLVVKPRVSRGGRGVVVATSARELPTLDTSMIIQEFAPGTEYCPQVYRSPLDGAITVVVLEKTTLRDGQVGNATGVRRLGEIDAADVRYLATSVVQALDLYGPVDMDIRRDSYDRPVVLEINARFGAHSAHAPELLAHLLTDARLLLSAAEPTVAAE